MSRSKQRSSGSYSGGDGRLSARPGPATRSVLPGKQALDLALERDALLYVPAGYSPEQPAPLAVMLHGAGGSAVHGLALLQELADSSGMLLLAPPSRRSTWDIIYSGYGADIAFMDRALSATFARCAVDPRRIAIGGFSDGASYALSVGIMNGDLFTHILAFSPGFMAPTIQAGQPGIFIAHGIEDEVLPIDRCSRRIVPQLEDAGYAVRYREFAGPHIVPGALAIEGVDWFTTTPQPQSPA